MVHASEVPFPIERALLEVSMTRVKNSERKTIKKELLKLTEDLKKSERSADVIKKAEDLHRKISSFSSEELLRPFTI